MAMAQSSVPAYTLAAQFISDRHRTVAKMMLQVQKAENSSKQPKFTKIRFVGRAKFCH